MSGKRKRLAWASVTVTVVAAFVIVHSARKRQPALPSISVVGAVLRQDSDTNKQLPVVDALIMEAHGLAMGECKSDSMGFFRMVLRPGIKSGQPLTLQFRHPEYQPLDLSELATDKIYIARMVPIPRQARPEPNRPAVTVANVVVKYSTKGMTVVNVGSAVRTFQVVNIGSVPCHDQQPCSPDGRWKAALGSASLDAGQGNEFHNARVSCIAGPCPFAKIESDGFSAGGRNINISVRSWSDTTTWLIEAELVHPMVTDIGRESYPVIFGPALNFTLPAGAEGVSIQADINGMPIIFPLGPSLLLSWADCNTRVNSDQTKVYRCELKSGYQFR